MQEPVRQKFFSRMLDRLSMPFMGIGFRVAEKILLDVIIQVERARKNDVSPEIRYLNLERHFKRKD